MAGNTQLCPWKPLILEGPFSAPTKFLLGLAHFLYTFLCLPLGLLVCNFFHGLCSLLVPRKLLNLPMDHPQLNLASSLPQIPLLHTSVH